METAPSLLLMATVLFTATLSGVFGMAGGMVLMGALLALLPVPQAMIAHGLLQFAANGARAVMLARHVRLRILGFYAVGSATAAILLQLVNIVPSTPWVYLTLGVMPLVAWLPTERVQLDAAKPGHAVACGATVTGMHVAAGASGPLLDLFFARTTLDRHSIVATKAATQVLAHVIKIAFYLWLVRGTQQAALPAWPWLLGGFALSLLGTWLGGTVLNRMSDKSFLQWTRWIITAIGAAYLLQALRLFWA